MFDPLFTLISNTLRANPKIIFDGQYDVDGGESFRLSFTAKVPAPNNQADIDLSEVFAQFPEGIAIQRIANLDYTKIRVPVGGPGNRGGEEYRGTFLLTVTKANWMKGECGTIESVHVSTDEDALLEDILQRYRKLPQNKQRQFLTCARLLLKGLAL